MGNNPVIWGGGSGGGSSNSSGPRVSISVLGDEGALSFRIHVRIFASVLIFVQPTRTRTGGINLDVEEV